MVKTAHLWDRDDLSPIQRMREPGSRCVLVKTEVRTCVRSDGISSGDRSDS